MTDQHESVGTSAPAAKSAAFFQQNTPTVTHAAASSAASILPERIGRYRILHQMGIGGMGVVYKAEQEQPRRSVALKVIKPGLASAEMIRRFAVESETLGRLQHPGIAQIYEAGTADAGLGPQPYFAMEFIKGEPLTAYARRHKLGTRDRLSLMVKICEAVQHAHQKGIIHRDLKPANILVDESAQPKILDFGVARLTGADIQTTTLRTDIGQLIGTIPYMSPEQTEGDPTNLDTRSDVYALGVICYELLAERLPYDLHNKMIHEAVRVIREEDPTRLSSVSRVFRGDVETIVAKALEKERARRYQSATEFAGDIERYLRDEPVVAKPANQFSRIAKFARRNKPLVGGLAATFLALIGGLIVALYLLGQTSAAEQRTRIAAEETKVQADKARIAAAKSERIATFTREMLSSIDPAIAGELDKTLLRKILDRAAARVGTELQNDPEVATALQTTIGEAYFTIGEYPQAEKQFRSAAETRNKTLGENDVLTLEADKLIGDVLWAKGDLDEAEHYYRRTLERLRRTIGENDSHTISLIGNLGRVVRDQGNFQEAESLLREAIEKARKTSGEDNLEALNSLNTLAGVLNAQGRFAEAADVLRDVVERRRRLLGPADPKTLASISNLAIVLNALGQNDEAGKYALEALDARRRVLGADHPDTIISINNLGQFLQSAGRLDEALLYYREALERSQRVLGAEHPRTIIAGRNVGAVLATQGKYQEAEPYLVDALDKMKIKIGDQHPDTLQLMMMVANLRVELHRFSDAEPMLLAAMSAADRMEPRKESIRWGMADAIEKLYARWNEAEPGKGYDAKADQWHTVMVKARAASQATARGGIHDDGAAPESTSEKSAETSTEAPASQPG